MSSRPLRILQILRAPVGGLFRHVHDLTIELAARGHAIGIVADSEGGDAQTEGKFAGLSAAASLGIHRVPIPRLLGAADASTPLRLRRLARSLGIDVLHGHGAKGGFAARLVRMGGGAPVALYTPHGGVLHFSPGSLSGRVFRTLERALLAQTDAIVFESAFAQRTYSEAIAAPRCPTAVIHNGLAEDEFEPLPLRPDAADFVFIGEFRTLKGIGFLLDALVSLKAPDGRPATLVMAGDGPQMAEFRGQIERLGLATRVELAGVRPAREMLARGRCLVVPSLAESLPYVVLEGAAAGRPVIGTRVGGVPEIYGPTAGSLLPPGDAAALGAAMQAVLDHPAAAAAEAKERLAYIRPRFSITAMADAIEALYRQALVARGRGD